MGRLGPAAEARRGLAVCCVSRPSGSPGGNGSLTTARSVVGAILLTRRVEGYPAMPLCRVFRCEPTRRGLRRLVGVLGKAQRWFSVAAVHRAALTSSAAGTAAILVSPSCGGAWAVQALVTGVRVGLVKGLRLSDGHPRRFSVAGAELVVDVVLEGVLGAAVGRLAIGSG